MTPLLRSSVAVSSIGVAHNPYLTADLYVPVDARPTGDDAGLPIPRHFPSPGTSTSEGLVCIGGCLEADWLLDAYRHGIFPWPIRADEPIPWWSPIPRGVLEFDDLHVSRRLTRTIRRGQYEPTCDRDFNSVIRGCATARGRRGNTWLTRDMIDAYCQLHRLGHAHSVEVWQQEQLVGGIYGVAIGGLFAAESMFCTVRDASKIALVHLVAHLQARGYRLLDVQQETPHTARLGVVEIPRREYLLRLSRCIDLPVTFGEQLTGDVASLLRGFRR